VKILFLCHRFPLPMEGGGKIRSLHMIRHLVASGHKVTLCSLIRTRAEADAAPTLEAEGVRLQCETVTAPPQAARMVLNLFSSRPSSFGYFDSPALKARVGGLVRDEHWDLIIVHCSSVGPYVDTVTSVPKIIDFADMDSQKWLDYARHKAPPMSWAFGLEGRKLERTEVMLGGRFDACVTISQNELDSLRAMGIATPSSWFPNGVDLDYFAPSAAETGGDANLVVFLGRMDYFPNEQAVTWFCREVWPSLLEARPALKFRIVGANPSRRVARLRREPGVEVTGFVDDVRPFVRGAALSVAPLQIARGLQNKVLECMAMGIPVVTNGRVASGLGLDGSSPLTIAEGAAEFAAAIGGLLDDPTRRARLSAESRALVERRFSWSNAMSALDRIVADAAGAAHAA
jgi:sugar transferase (PEP-CTERM/EpsH1 system associated)